MMKLIIRKKGQVLSEIVLDPSKSWIAGRKADADIVLDGEKGISREHFRIYHEGDTWRVEILTKLDNVKTNGQRFGQAAITPGFTFTCLDYEFEAQEIVGSDSVMTSTAQVNPDDRTIIHRSNELAAYVKIMNDEGDIQQKIKLEGSGNWIAGRDVNAQIMISDHRVSRKQFEIRKSALGYEIIDLGSVNGTSVNEKILVSDEPVLLKSGDVIRVLDHKLQFEILDPNFFDKIEKLPALSDPQPTSEEPAPEPEIEYVDDPQYLPAEYVAQQQQIDPYALSAPSGYDPGATQADEAAEKTKKFRMMLLAIVAVGIIAYVFTSGPKGEDSSQMSAAVPLTSDPLSGLTPQQKSEYKQSIELAKRYHMEGNYNLALSEVEELAKKYEKIKDPELERVKNTAQAAIESQKLLIKQEKEAKEREAMEARIQEVTAVCRKKILTFASEEQLDSCLVDALQLNPVHPHIVDLKTRMQGIMADKEVQRLKNAEYNKKVAQLKSMHDKAKEVEKEGDYIKTIEAYKRVIDSSLPDPNGLKSASTRYLAKLRAEMDRKVNVFIKQAQDYKSKQELKQAITTLRSAIKIDPTRQDLKDQVDELKNELRKQMMVYYQEGVLEEGFGNVEGGDNRIGAKEKWKKILELDVSDGEYYQKAFIKLKKYGAQ